MLVSKNEMPSLLQIVLSEAACMEAATMMVSILKFIFIFNDYFCSWRPFHLLRRSQQVTHPQHEHAHKHV